MKRMERAGKNVHEIREKRDGESREKIDSNISGKLYIYKAGGSVYNIKIDIDILAF